jgi:hypothetical protein
MMKYGRWMVAGAAMMAVIPACGGSGGVSSTKFVDSVNEACRTLARDLRDIDEPSSVDAVGAYADKASLAYESALASLKKLPVPGDAKVVADAKDLLANLDDQVNLLDDITAAAKSGDAGAVATKVSSFNKLTADNADVADSLGASRCALDPVLAAVATTSTTTTSTTPTTTTTAPPVTTTPVTLVRPTSPNTVPPTGSPSSDKTILPLAAEMTKGGGYTFADADTSLVKSFVTLLTVVPSTSSATGKVAGVEVSDKGGNMFSRVFLFYPDSALPAATMDEIVTAFAGTDPQQKGAIGKLQGVYYTSTAGRTFFVGANPYNAPAVVIWAVATDKNGVDTAVKAFVAALPN